MIFSPPINPELKPSRSVQEIPLSELHPFEGHPFRVVDDEEMMKTAKASEISGSHSYGQSRTPTVVYSFHFC